MASHIVGCPCMGPKRELELAFESFCEEKISAEEFQKVATMLRSSIGKPMADAGINHDVIVPELGPDDVKMCSQHKAVAEYKGTKAIHMIYDSKCSSNFKANVNSIMEMDANMIIIENSCSDEKLLSVFREGVKYGAGIDPGVYGIHYPKIPPTEEIAHDNTEVMKPTIKNKVAAALKYVAAASVKYVGDAAVKYMGDAAAALEYMAAAALEKMAAAALEYMATAAKLLRTKFACAN